MTATAGSRLYPAQPRTFVTSVTTRITFNRPARNLVVVNRSRFLNRVLTNRPQRLTVY